MGRRVRILLVATVPVLALGFCASLRHFLDTDGVPGPPLVD